MRFSAEVSEMSPCRKKFPKFVEIVKKYFPGDFSPEEISPGELSGICWNKTLVYSCKFVFFRCVTSL